MFGLRNNRGAGEIYTVVETGGRRRDVKAIVSRQEILGYYKLRVVGVEVYKVVRPNTIKPT